MNSFLNNDEVECSFCGASFILDHPGAATICDLCDSPKPIRRNTYRVIWEIDVEADNAEAAACQALKIQRDLNSMAMHFTVSCGSETVLIEIDASLFSFQEKIDSYDFKSVDGFSILLNEAKSALNLSDSDLSELFDVMQPIVTLWVSGEIVPTTPFRRLVKKQLQNYKKE